MADQKRGRGVVSSEEQRGRGRKRKREREKEREREREKGKEHRVGSTFFVKICKVISKVV